MIILGIVFYPLVRLETTYALANYPERLEPEEVSARFESLAELQAPTTDLFLAIPKIGAYAPIITNVDPGDQTVYESALKQGVAHASGTSLPGESGNSFVFAHSSTSWGVARSANTQFYLLGKLQPGDEIYAVVQGEVLTYRVTDKQIVNPDQIEYLGQFTPEKRLTLMTCYPIGTSLQRLLVFAELVE